MIKKPIEVKKIKIEEMKKYSHPVEDNGICTGAIEEIINIILDGKVSYWGGGKRAQDLENRFSNLIGKKNGFFHNSGSSALITAVKSFQLSVGDDVAISSSGFISSLNALYHANLRPRFIPTNEDTLMSEYPDSYEVTYKCKLALVTHFFGNVVDIDNIMKKTGAKYLIEDSSQALGSKLDGDYVGKRGDISVFAGSNRKLFGAGQGGISLYDDENLGKIMRIIGHHGKKDNVTSIYPGFNFRGGEMEAALGLESLKCLSKKMELRNESAKSFCDIVNKFGIKTAKINKKLDAEVVWFDNAIILPKEWKKQDRDYLVDILDKIGVPAWIYPSLIETPWVIEWMKGNNWWGEEEEEILKYEKNIWDRVFVVGTQMNKEDSVRCAKQICEILLGDNYDRKKFN